MARLLVEAISKESKSSGDIVYKLELYVSVSWADTGEPVTGLTSDNFKVCYPYGLAYELFVHGGYESKWEPEDNKLAGCYALEIGAKKALGEPGIKKWTEGEFYSFGIQARLPDRANKQVHYGQTVVRIQSLGN